MSILDQLQLVAAHEAPDVVGVPAGTVRRWASEPSRDDGMPVLAARGLDARGRPLYSRADLETLRERPRRAAHATRVDRKRSLPNTAANGRRVSTPRSVQ